MGLEDEFKLARDWVAENLNFDRVRLIDYLFNRLKKNIVIDKRFK